MNLTSQQLLFTKEGREHLRVWCDKTVLRGDAESWLKALAEAEKLMPVAPSFEELEAAD